MTRHNEFPAHVGRASQTGDRIGYYPQTAEKELAQFHELVLKVQTNVEALAKAGVSEEEKKRLAEALGPMWDTPEAQRGLTDHPNRMARALAAVNDAVGKGSNSSGLTNTVADQHMGIRCRGVPYRTDSHFGSPWLL